MSHEFQVSGTNAAALFTLKLHRGDGMTLIAMNWKKGKPPADFAGFAIEYKAPGGDRFFPLKNRLAFAGAGEKINPNILSTRLSPIQKFRWVHFPFNANLEGDFVYRVSPVFMNKKDELSYGESQEASIQLRRETYPNQLNIAFTRGFVSSQAFVDKYVSDKDTIAKLLPAKAADGLDFHPTHSKADEALTWMGFEAREEILSLLDEAIADKQAKVFVIAYDLNEPGVVSRLKQLGARVKVIIDDEGDHGKDGSAENEAEQELIQSAGINNVKRQHMGKIQHNKTIVVDGPNVQAAAGGSTNFSWRGFYVQSNNAVVVRGKDAIQPFLTAFQNYWANNNQPQVFGATDSAKLNDLKLAGIDVKVAFSPHSAANALLQTIADDMSNTASSLFFSLAFLYETPGPILDAIKKIKKDDKLFIYGISDKKVGGLELTKPDSKVSVVNPTALSKNLPQPFKSEPTGGGGTRLHHKFVVIDFDKPTARVYTGSYNFSSAADNTNGENLWIIRDRRIAISYMIEALSIFDHYHFRVLQEQAGKAKKKLFLKKPPRRANEKPWWDEDYTNPRKIHDRELFA